MRQQAKKCSQKELAHLSYWRERGFKFGVGDKVPMNTVTPPSFATRHPIADALLGVGIIATVCSMAALWVAVGAGII